MAHDSQQKNKIRLGAIIAGAGLHMTHYSFLDC